MFPSLRCGHIWSQAVQLGRSTGPIYLTRKEIRVSRNFSWNSNRFTALNVTKHWFIIYETIFPVRSMITSTKEIQNDNFRSQQKYFEAFQHSRWVGSTKIWNIEVKSQNEATSVNHRRRLLLILFHFLSPSFYFSTSVRRVISNSISNKKR